MTYCDAKGAGCDVFGCRGLAAMIEEVSASHPLLRVEVVSRGLGLLDCCFAVLAASCESSQRCAAAGAGACQRRCWCLNSHFLSGFASLRKSTKVLSSRQQLPPPRAPQDDIAVDASGCSAVAEWHATAAHLGHTVAGGRATGLVSEINGCDQITFGPDGLITSILSFRDRFAEEEEAEARLRLERGGGGEA